MTQTPTPGPVPDDAEVTPGVDAVDAPTEAAAVSDAPDATRRGPRRGEASDDDDLAVEDVIEDVVVEEDGRRR